MIYQINYHADVYTLDLGSQSNGLSVAQREYPNVYMQSRMSLKVAKLLNVIVESAVLAKLGLCLPLQRGDKARIIRASFAMVTLIGPPAMISHELRQAWKGATVVVTSCAGVWLV